MSRMNEMKTERRYEINARIAQNINRLRAEHGISIGALCTNLEKEGHVSIDRTTLSKFLNHPDKHDLPLPFIISCADYFKVTIDEIMRHGFDMDIECEDNEKTQAYFINNPKSPFWTQYLQTYFCYYYSTISDENRNEDSLIEGTLQIRAEGGLCRAIMEVDTKKYKKTGEKIFKVYSGYAVLCPATATIYCNMRENNIGDYCSIVFRYAQVNFTKQACRMAEVLSTSSKPERRYPVVHRMFLSKERIEEKDWRLIKPHLLLNYSKIIIGKKELKELRELDESYDKVMGAMEDIDFEMVHVIKESKVRQVADQYLSSKQVVEFITELRSRSLAYRYNKVSPRVDSNLWEILNGAGYYDESQK